MADVYSKEIRSYTMSRIRKKDTKPELIVRKYLFKKGFRYRIHYKKLLGNPDIVFPKMKIAIFINGCFWHAHENCKYNRLPKSNVDYWIPKINRNVERDRKNHGILKDDGWDVIIIWECQIIDKSAEKTLDELVTRIKKHF